MLHPSEHEQSRLDASVVVCAFSDRRFELLRDTIASLAAQTVPTAEIVIVVDHNQALLDRARSSWPEHRIVANTGRRGLAAARNTGAAIVRSDVVAFVDDDAVADPRWIETLLTRYLEPDVAAVGGVVEPIWGSPRPVWLGHEYDWVVGCSHSAMPTTLAPVRNLIGANMSFRRSVLEKVGGFREDVGRVDDRPFGCEETELCIRLRQRLAGARVLYDPHARVRHHVPAERLRLGYFLRRCFAEGRSKAVVLRLVGSAAVSEERRYVRTTISRGIVTALAAPTRGGAARAAALVCGVCAASAGFVYELVRPMLALRDRQ